jgi:anti-sigma B factor antagonist
MSCLELARITVETVEEARLIRVAGEVDASTAGALSRCLRSAQDERATLVLDLSDVCFLDSSGLRVLLDASRAAVDTGWPFFIVRPSSTVRRLIGLTGTGTELALIESREPEAA